MPFLCRTADASLPQCLANIIRASINYSVFEVFLHIYHGMHVTSFSICNCHCYFHSQLCIYRCQYDFSLLLLFIYLIYFCNFSFFLGFLSNKKEMEINNTLEDRKKIIHLNKSTDSSNKRREPKKK